MIREIVRRTHLRWAWTPLGPLPPTGKRVAISSILMCRVAGGEIVSEWREVDWLRAL